MSKFNRKFEERGSGGDSSLFVKLDDGQSVVGVLRGPIAEMDIHWVGKRSQECQGRGCPLCAEGDYPKFRFKTNLVVLENGAYIAKIFEQGRIVYEQLQALEGDYDMESTAVKITRNGTGTDTTYSVIPVPPKQQPNAQALKSIAATRLNELGPKQPLKAVNGGKQAQADADESGNFGEESSGPY